MIDGKSHLVKTRRQFVRMLHIVGLAVGVILEPLFAQKKQDKEEEEVSTNEDLMREHGVLKRVLLAYDEIIRRIHAKEDFSPQAVIYGATIIRKFIEEYHEKLEEEHLFPRFRKAGKLVELVDTLEAQHRAGRHLTERILSTATA